MVLSQGIAWNGARSLLLLDGWMDGGMEAAQVLAATLLLLRVGGGAPAAHRGSGKFCSVGLSPALFQWSVASRGVEISFKERVPWESSAPFCFHRGPSS